MPTVTTCVLELDVIGDCRDYTQLQYVVLVIEINVLTFVVIFKY